MAKNKLHASRWTQEIHLHLRSLLTSLGQMVQAPWGHFATAMVIALALALPFGGNLLLQNVKQLSHQLDAPGQITLYLQPGTPDATIQQMIQTLKTDPDIQTVDFISAAQGLSDFAKYTGFQDTLSQFTDNPIPPVITLLPTAAMLNDDTSLQPLLVRMQQLPNVMQAQLDLTWLKRLNAWIAVGERLILILAVMFTLGILFIIGNTIRLATQERKEEIFVMKLLGATDGFIRRPFLYLGSLYGCIGSIIAWILLGLMILFLQNPASHVASLYGSQVTLEGLTLQGSLTLILGGSLLGWLAAWFSTNRFIRQIDEIE